MGDKYGGNLGAQGGPGKGVVGSEKGGTCREVMGKGREEERGGVREGKGVGENKGSRGILERAAVGEQECG